MNMKDPVAKKTFLMWNFIVFSVIIRRKIYHRFHSTNTYVQPIDIQIRVLAFDILALYNFQTWFDQLLSNQLTQQDVYKLTYGLYSFKNSQRMIRLDFAWILLLLFSQIKTTCSTTKRNISRKYILPWQSLQYCY